MSFLYLCPFILNKQKSMALKLARLNCILFVSVMLISCSSGGQTNANEAKTTSVPDSSFQKSIKENPVVLADFSASWCAPCRMLAPIVDSIATEQKGKLVVIKIDVDKNRGLAGKMQITDLPTLLLFKNGKQVWRSEGLMPKEVIMDAIKNKN